MDWNFGSLSLNSAYQIIEKSRFPGTFILTSDDKNRFITLLLTTDPAPEVVLIGIFQENNQFSLFLGYDREKKQFSSLTALVNYFHFWPISGNCLLRKTVEFKARVEDRMVFSVEAREEFKISTVLQNIEILNEPPEPLTTVFPLSKYSPQMVKNQESFEPLDNVNELLKVELKEEIDKLLLGFIDPVDAEGRSDIESAEEVTQLLENYAKMNSKIAEKETVFSLYELIYLHPQDEQSQTKNRKHFQVNLMTREDFQEFSQKENSIKIAKLHNSALCKVHKNVSNSQFSSFSPLKAWRLGVQMVNMNLRPTRYPENMELHRAMFKRNGNCGYVPKSGNLLTKLVSNSVLLKCTILEGSKLWGQKQWKDTVHTVSVCAWVVAESGREGKTTPVIATRGNGLRPIWNLKIPPIVISRPELGFFVLEVSHSSGHSNMKVIGKFVAPVVSLRSGIRSVNLENPSFQHEIPFASILVHLEMLTKMDIKEQYEQIRNNPADASTFEDGNTWEQFAKHNLEVDGLFDPL
ncbi:1-phosphatidylinositol 4,5-bisphosphate phosphodiesterase delta-4 isoform X2 [Eurytemora carolleeae]|uniref:1-phosphatidylinositol 4,5-bisphosphate phosphodiesterase delta-4 isoform X2 n=1 Tax=Eurytemora carolleeae TaxID=1294199 RepID=UPI000C76D468|nr:1-phosphatidylinositol 4,5-bisphosphate phosphodiesterase delta-4 isoform X2 [Eurytemora carolleeae]|eukprot:XP_023346613.1 1-phosphatidylinositol 4,5-bisphosphate phosphodiesterase delta-4-like isoform X2 [Eurytemora affinis]